MVRVSVRIYLHTPIHGQPSASNERPYTVNNDCTERLGGQQVDDGRNQYYTKNGMRWDNVGARVTGPTTDEFTTRGDMASLVKGGYSSLPHTIAGLYSTAPCKGLQFDMEVGQTGSRKGGCRDAPPWSGTVIRGHGPAP